MRKCYFDSLRKILDTKVPVMFDVEDTCAPPLAKSILEFVKRPFSVQSPTFLDEYRYVTKFYYLFIMLLTFIHFGSHYVWQKYMLIFSVKKCKCKI